MADKKFDLGEYVEVKDRIKLFYELYGQGRLVTANYELTREPDDKPKVIVTAYAYRTTDDPHPGVGTSWMYLPGKTPYTAGSEIENVETSAWGRAIGSLGILIDRSIATSTEIESKAGETVRETTREPVMPSGPILVGPWDGTGKVLVRKSGTADGNIRQGPDGPFMIFAFATVEGQTIPQVMATGALAMDLLDAAGAELPDMAATISGDLYRIPWEKDGTAMPPFQRLTLKTISTMAWTLPVPGSVDAEAELDALLP